MNRRLACSAALGGSLIALLAVPAAWAAPAGAGRKPAARPAPKSVPSDAVLRQMVKRSLLEFNGAIQTKDFTRFYAGLAKLWQEQTTPDKLQEIFREFIDKQIDISPIGASTPRFNGPAKIDGQGILSASGLYPVRPLPVQFTLNYIQESGAWKLVGINVTVAPSSPSPSKAVPPDTELQPLVTDSLVQFNRAVQSKDFSSLYNSLSRVWQEQTTPEKLKKSFQEFIDKQVNISGVADAAPKLTPRPTIDNRGVLIVAGEYPTKPSTVNFRLEYLKEADQWKLVGINVTVR